MVIVQSREMIDILVPVLGRPQNAQPLVDSIRANTTVDNRIVFLCDYVGDFSEYEACREAMHTQAPGTVVIIDSDRRADTGDYARKINQGFKMSRGDWVFVGADDISFQLGWDTTALKKAGTHYDVVATNDMANAHVRRGDFGTHCLVRRRYVTDHGATADHTPGLLLHEGYDHNFVDRELCHVAQNEGRFIFARHSRVPHRHPLWRTAPQDDTYRKALANFRRDHQLFLSRAHLWNYVGLSGNERKAAA